MNNQYSEEEIRYAFEHFMSEANDLVKSYMIKNFSTLPEETIEVKEGSVYWKIIKVTSNSRSRSVYGFVRKSDGAIFKAATWSAPYTKGKSAIRGYVTDEFAKSTLTPYGIIYAQ